MDRGVEAGEGEISAQAFAWLLGSLHALARLPFDPALFLSRFPPPYGPAALLSALKAAGFRAGQVSRRLGGLRSTAIAFRRAASGALLPLLVLRSDSDRVVYFEAGSNEPRKALIPDLEGQCEPVLLAVAPPEAGDAQVAGFEAERRPFGFRWFIPELLRYRAIWRDVLIASAAIMVIGLATPLFTQVVVDKVVVHQTTSTLLVIGAAMAVFLVFNAVMSWMRQYLVIHTGNRVDAVLATGVLDHLLRLPLPYFERRPTGVTVARLQGVETIRDFITGAAVAFVLDLPFLLIVLAVMFGYSWQLTLIALGIVATLTAVSIVVTPVLRERLNRQFMLGARNQAFLTEYVAGVETVKTLQFEPVLERRYGDFLASYLSSSFAARGLSNTYNVVANALEQLMTLSILVVGALLVMRNDGFTIGMLVAFQMFAARMAQPMLRIAGLWQEFQQATIAVRRLGDILDAPTEPHTLAPSRAGDGAGRIDLQGVSFRYGEQHPYLFRNLSIAIQPGSLVLVTGPSGCGKSTLAKLLLGFYQPTDGRIQIDGRDVRHLAANELRQSFGVVPQETTLFSGTIYDNLAMANPHAGFADIVNACRAAEIHDVIEKLPQGYQTAIGEHGVGLSGGQKQRIAIARALLKRPKILIFDEATSNLDAHTAEQFAQTVNRLKGETTIIFIAHQVPHGLNVDQALRFGRATREQEGSDARRAGTGE